MHTTAVRKTRRYLLVALLLAVLGFVSWLILSQPREPVYQGKPLSYWCEQYSASRWLYPTNEPDKQAETAIRTIGTNAVPTLLRMFKATDSKLKLKLFELAAKQHLVVIKWKSAQLLHYEALHGLFALGTDAQSAVPDLVEIYNERHLLGILDLFSFMGPAAADAVPRLVQETSDTNYNVRFSALRALGQIHARPDLTVPVLTKSLRDPVLEIQGTAAAGLAAFGTDAKSAVPELIKALADPDPYVRGESASALQKIDPEAAVQAGVK